MSVQYAKEYIDRAFAAQDVPTLYNVISVLEPERDLPEPLTLFVRLWEWIGSTRSGVWQYYENIRMADFSEISAMMDRNELTQIASRYRAGMDCWNEPRYCDDLDSWIDANETMLEEAAFRLIEPHRDSLYPNKI